MMLLYAIYSSRFHKKPLCLKYTTYQQGLLVTILIITIPEVEVALG